MNKQIIVTGASSIIGLPLLHFLEKHCLENQSYTVIKVSRSENFQVSSIISKNISWDMQQQKLSDTLLFEQLRLKKESTLIHCAPIWFLMDHVIDLASAGIKRIIAFSSSSIEGKANSSSQHEQAIVTLLSDAEKKIEVCSQQSGIQLTIFRPTMIYGYGHGQNLAFMAKCIQKFGIFPIVTHATGLRRPVHANDLANAACLALENPNTFDKIYNLSGAQEMTYEMMVSEVFKALGKPIRMPKIPLPLYRQSLKMLSQSAKLIGKSLSIDPAMADRMREDLNFDNDLAIQDFAYAPSAFLPNGKQDLLGQNLFTKVK